MLHRLLRCFKFWGLVVGLGVMMPVSAQIGYWSELGNTTPCPSVFNDSIALYGPGFTSGPMWYNKGYIYVSFYYYRNYIGVWNGTNWHSYQIPDTFDASHGYVSRGNIFAWTADNNGNIYMAGRLIDNTGVIVIKWDGTNFSKVGQGLPYCDSTEHFSFYGNAITTLCSDSAGNIYAGGMQTSRGNQYVAKWDGNSWSILDSNTTVIKLGQGYVHSFDEGMGTYGNTLYATATTGIVRWNGNSWVNIDTPNSHVPIGFIIGPNGNIYASFENQVAVWNGSSWTQLGNFNLPRPEIGYLSLDPAGNVYVANDDIGGGITSVVKWDGNTWSELGTNNFALHANSDICNLAVSSTGDSIFAIGLFTNGANSLVGLPYVAVYTTVPPGRLFVYLNATPTNCGNNGTITSTIYQGTPPYSYVWSTGDTAANLRSLVSGQYYVTVTDAHGLVAIGDITVPAGTCQSLITGTVFVDTAGTCNYNGQQAGLPNVILTLSGNSQTLYATTDANGDYSFAMPDTGNFHLNIQSGYNNLCGNFTLCGNPNQIIRVGVLGDTVSNNNFAFNPSSSGYDLYLHPGWTAADPGFEKDYWIYFANNSPVPFTGAATVAFKYDSNLTFISSDSAYTSYDASADSITWVVNNFHNGGWNFIGKVRFNVPETLPLNYQLQSQFWIYPKAGDCDSTNNYLQYFETVVGAHDPNYKEVSPAGNILRDDSVLTYTIHYQNTGTDSTYFIKVTDMLSPYLDPATVRNLASSAPYSSFTISGTGLLTWAFVPYSLPDSTMDAQASQGFITFSVKKKSEVPVRTDITNTASVYFDYAPPVLTNRVADSVVYPPCLATLYDTVSATICAGNIFYVGANVHTHTGTFTDTLINQNSGCDSIVTLHLTVNPLSFDTIRQSICTGDTFYFAGLPRMHAGYYYDTLRNRYACDSIVTLILTVKPQSFDTVRQSMCSGDTFYFASLPRTHTGYYYDTLRNLYGCDSIVTLILTLKPQSFDTIIRSICNGDTIHIGTHVYTQTGTYIDTLTNITGCDSIITLILTVTNRDTINLFSGLCVGDSVYFYGNYIKSVGTYDTLLSGGCDTLVILTVLTLDPIGPTYIYDTICATDSILFNGTYADTTGFYYAHYSNVTGCDSMVILQLTVNGQPPVLTSNHDTICGGDTVTFTASAGYDSYVFANGGSLQQSGASNIWVTNQLGLGNAISVRGEQNGCTSLPGNRIDIYVNPLPVVSFTWDSLIAAGDFRQAGYPYLNAAFYCSPPLWGGFPDTVQLVGGSPPGGVYSGGSLVRNNVFYGDSIPSWVVTFEPITYFYHDSNGCKASVTDTILINYCEGINPINPNTLFTLYPNPAGDYVMIDYDAAYTGSTVFVKDITGRELLQTKLSASPQQIPTGGLPPGVYLVTLYNKGQVGARLLVKE